MSEPIAYFLTWTTYGTRLHGDDRGTVDCLHNIPGSPVLPPSSRRAAWEASQLKRLPVVFDHAQREVVEATIRAHCAFRCWRLLALAVRSNHVHVVIENSGVPPETTMDQFKAWATRRLREAGKAAAGDRVWASHGSTRYLWKSDRVAEAVRYVEEAQDIPH